MNPLVAILRPIFDAFFAAAFNAWRESQRAEIEPMTEADRAEIDRIRNFLRDHPPAGPGDSAGMCTTDTAGLRKSTQDR